MCLGDHRWEAPGGKEHTGDPRNWEHSRTAGAQSWGCVEVGGRGVISDEINWESEFKGKGNLL